jgi:hypothetical protein
MRSREDVFAMLREYDLKVFPLKDKRPAKHLVTWKEIDENVPMGTPFGVSLGGINNIYVIDLDDSRLIPYFQTLINKTYSVKSGNGVHIHIQGVNLCPKNGSINTKYGHIDIKSHGGYVVGETSEHYNKEKDENGKDVYFKSGKKYELIPDSPLKISYVDPKEIGKIYDAIGVQHSKENPINPKKDNIKKRNVNALENGVEVGNRNNEYFALACNNLKSGLSPETAYDNICYINEKSQEPLSKEEVDKLFQSATARVQKEIEEGNTVQKTDDDEKPPKKKSSKKDQKVTLTFERIYKEPQPIHAITLDQESNTFILVYLPVKKVKENEDGNVEITYPILGHFVTKGSDGKKACFRIHDKSQLSQEDYVIENLYPEFKPLKGKWTNEDIDAYLLSDSRVNVKDLFEDMMKLERKYFEKQFDYDYYFEIVWILHTYFYTLFQYTPYIDLIGDKGVGKSKNITFLKALSYNGYSSGDVSVSAIFRIVQGTGVSLFLDESENMQGGDKVDDQKDKQTLLRNGFHIDGSVTRANTTRKDFKPETFSVYSPKGLAHINSFDEVLTDRTIPVNIIASDKPEIVKAHPNNDPKEIYNCRKREFELFLDYAVEVNGLIAETEYLMESHDIHGRDMDLWKPIVTIALFLDKQGVEKVLDKIIAKMENISHSKKNDNLEDNLSFRILDILDKHIDQIPKYSKPLYKFINEKYEEEGFDPLRQKEIRTTLVRLGFHQGNRENVGVPWINITPERIHDIKVRRNLVKPTQNTLEDTDSSHKNDDNVDNVGSVV